MSSNFNYDKILHSNINYNYMDYENLLNEKQLEAVTTKSKHTRIIAGAGSGKTRVLTYRISYLINEMNVKPMSIVAIAFTNKVAEEMKTRALSLIPGQCNGLSVSTFHSFCAKFLRKEIDVLGFPNNFTIMDEDDQTTLIKDIAVENGYKRNDDIVKYTISYIGWNKCKGYYPTDLVNGNNKSVREKEALKMFHIYEQKKDQMLSLDFDDLLLKTIEILENHEEIRDKWQKRISNILIDEFQDTNDVQYKLVKLLCNENTSIYVVGDPDQTIYTWRGANQDIILNFIRDFPLTETIILDRNYRSTKSILSCANELIKHNEKRVPKNLYTLENDGEKVSVQKYFSREEEAKNVIDTIENLVNSNKGITYKDIVILYRAAYLTLPFEHEMMRRRIPYQIYGGTKFFQRKEIKDILAYFRLIYNEKDDLSFERIINVPRRGIGDHTLDILKSEKEIAGLSYIEYIKNIENYNSEVKSKTIMALSYMISLLEKTKKELDDNLIAYPMILSDFVRDLGYFDYLQSDDESEDRIDHVKTLLDDIVDFLKKYPESSFEEYLQNATLQTSQDEIKDANKLTLMTVHVAKGLEFSYVFVVSMIDGVFPSQRTMDESGHEGEEEERRLCYVAFTRAKKRLYLSYNGAYSFVLESKAMESRFIKESGLQIQSKNDYYMYRPKTDFYSQVPKQNYDKFDDIREVEEPKIEDNGIRDWKIGDVAIHEVFGKGIVKNIIDDTILEIEFETHGAKSILASHPKVKKGSGGAKA